MNRALLPLAIGAFAIGSTEFAIMGLLPEIGETLGATVPAMGLLITAYALGVVVGAPILTALSAWISSKQTLVALMAVFAVGNLLSAFATDYRMMLISRVVASLAHGSFFGVGAIVARRLAPPGKQTQAISLMFTGLTVANLLGVPLGTWLGQTVSWRLVFGIIAGLGVLTMIAVAVAIPDDDTRINLRQEVRAFKLPQVWFGLGITTVAFGALFAVYSYITPILNEHTGIDGTMVTIVLALYGLGTTVGSIMGGRLGDRYGLPMVAWGLGAGAVLLVIFTVTSHSLIGAIITLIAFGAIMFALGPVVQNRVIEAAGPSGGGSLVSALNQGAFNIANAIGAALGALVIDLGWGYSATMWVGAALSLLGAGVVTVAVLADRRSAVKSSVLLPV